MVVSAIKEGNNGKRCFSNMFLNTVRQVTAAHNISLKRINLD